MNAGFDGALGATDDLCDLRERQVLEKMQDQNLAMQESDLIQRRMNRRGIFFGERRLLGLLKLLD